MATNELQCVNCLDIWKDDESVFLFCQHVICLKCIDRLERRNFEIICPQCIETGRIPGNQVNKLPKSFFKPSIQLPPSIGNNLCKIHQEELLLYCQTENIENICLKCLDKDHKNCKIFSMSKFESRKQQIENFLKEETENEENLQRKIDEHEKKATAKLQNEFQNIRKIIKNTNKTRQKYYNSIFNENIEVEDFLHNFKKLEIQIVENIQINCHIQNNSNVMKSIDIAGNLLEIQTENSCQQTDEDKIKNSSNLIDLSKRFVGEKELRIIWKTIQLSKHKTVNVNLENCCNLEKELSIKIGNLLKHCSTIESINLGYNKTMDNGFFNICNGLEQSFNTLKNINLFSCNLNDEQNRMVGKLFKKCSQLETIHLGGNLMMENGLLQICDGLEQAVSTLKDLNFIWCNLNEEHCKHIGKLLKRCSKIETINIGGNENMGNGLSNICNGLVQSSNSLKHVIFFWCNLNENECKMIGNLFENCSNIETINFEWNQQMGNGLFDICKVLLQSSNSLKEINFLWCDLNEQQCRKIGKLFEYCSNIEKIHFGGNGNMGNGLFDICSGLVQSANNLRVVNFLDCNLNEEECRIIGNLLKNCSRIEVINLKRNQQMGNGLFEICSGLIKSSSHLKEMDFLGCNLNEEQCKQIGNLLKYCFKLEIINLKRNQQMGNGLFDICSGLVQSANALKEINFLGCNLNEEECKRVLNMFKNFSKIQIEF
ncbi:unnamed protein product [Dimorphilus gyrociliatus]|uniref:RING-type domain-containing protein n=1 Tax=Dimorphilus gyrociliatus TaxID=2664684 RepID=A0A7I8WFG1_9ANNE|nr:unnamed protein product [Dimorphilus gyrociliatus]